ncbi:MAG: translation initiation factor IF-1 [Candidatus Magasanikbacteria bacterium RIFOXYD2_FULL_39_9]|uniref:Translation initiation factor IF-1 n=1 Tax=Candidatus Magasanikbacteria bacterium RIFOXYD1_FULL_40_23 TaxID=1798705 RepID=A0A1F6PAQ7_9BACT|nr:MAG: translation initiation factor IF-1 [Candidatus Magasanikbacteria bacterium RIFOXYD2_FULL_39_9]OGH93249.1 MAG: translation initiation factor IF-1 [Candidatus Magasanikbacteria bacterium RIFOXYD1_FULL_40_23]
MAKTDLIELKGRIEELLPATTFKVKLESGQIVLGHLSGKLRMNKIRLSLGDSVRVEMTPYDLTKGRITYRF